MNQTIQELFDRKSVRAYSDEIITPEEKEWILKSALQAPTAGNMALYSIIDIQDQSLKDQLAITCDHQPFISQAPMVLLFLADYQKWYDAFKYYQKDNGVRKPDTGDFLLAYSDALIAAQNAVVAGESMGIGSCFIGDIIEQYEFHRDLFNLPRYTVPVAMLVMGYPAKGQLKRKKPVRFDSKYVVSVDQYEHFNDEKIAAMFYEKAKNSNRPGGGQAIVDDIYNRKWTDPFIEEMSRSAKLWIERWQDNKKE